MKKRNRSEYMKKYREKNKDKLKEYREKNKENRKEYLSQNKEKIKENRKKYLEQNKEKIQTDTTEYYINNKEEIKDRVKKYNTENKDKIKEYNKIYYIKNKKRLNEYRRNYYKNRIDSDPLFRLKSCIRSLISTSFRKSFSKKAKKTIEILGCSFEEFKIYIENMFDMYMSWDNYVIYWQLDHIRPISWAKNEKELYELNHYTNFKPLYWKDNLDKSNKFEG